MPQYKTSPVSALTACRQQLAELAWRSGLDRQAHEISDRQRSRALIELEEHLAHLGEALRLENPGLYAAHLAWVQSLHAAKGYAPQQLTRTCNLLGDAIQQLLPSDEAARACEIIEQALQDAAGLSTEPPSPLQGPHPLRPMAGQYLELLLSCDRGAASQLISNLIAADTPIADIYLEVFEPALREVGRRWQLNQVTVAQEHYCTAATQFMMAQFYPAIFASPRRGLRMVVACVSGELHEVGARMVADLAELNGWDTFFIGANTPLSGIFELVVQRQAHMLALSATMTYHIATIEEIISALRDHHATRSTRILVGGHPFNQEPSLWKLVGADGFACDARQAVQAAEQLLAGG